ncbi:MAG: CPBP family intramembrane metalloprotease [Lachnospiraceae bacterium]|nr:CPBP family intramembrane metalloprotease [Lachnospiraceae bacterium]
MKTNQYHSTDNLSMEQKLWFGVGNFLYSMRPLILYTCLPALFMTLGRVLMRERSVENIISTSGNFYYTLGIIFTFVLLQKRSKKRGSSLYEEATLEWKDINKNKIQTLLLMGFGFGFFFSALVTVVPFPELLINSYRDSSSSLTDGTDQILALFSTAILAPVTEEIVFRGYMLNRQLEYYTERTCIWITSVIFALCHVSFIWIVYALLMGLLLAKVSIEEDNIAYSIALHIGFNFNVVPVWIINHIPSLKNIIFANHLLIAIYGAAAGYGALLLYKKYRKETKKW